MPPYHVALLPGDGVGPEVVAEARKVVEALGLPISWTELDWGSDHYHRTGRMMPDDAIETVRGSSLTDVVPVRPPESRAVSRSSRWDGYS